VPEASQTGSGFTQSETGSISFGSTVIVAYNDSGSNAGGQRFTGYARSTDSGNTFTDLGALTSSNDDAGDPVLARDNTNGNIYMTTLSFNGSLLKMFRSIDNGLTFQPSVNALNNGSASYDKEWVAVDNFGGPGQGNVYVVARDFGSTNGIVFTKSTNGGLTFSAPVTVTTASGVQGANIVVNADHSLSAFWYQTGSIQTRRSTDFGATFSAPVTVSTLVTTGTNGDLGLTRSNTVSTVFRSNAFPSVQANPTVPGNIYLAFADRGTGGDKANIRFTQSTDYGATWSAPVILNTDGTTRDQWQPSVRVSPNGLRVAVSWYDRRNDTNNTAIDYYARSAVVTGNTLAFGTDFRLTDATFLPDFGRDGLINPVYMGDYDQGTATNSNLYFVWADNRLGGPDIRVQAVSIAAGGPFVNFATPTGIAATASPIDFTFDQAMNPSSFDLATDVLAYTRGGVDVRNEITGFSWINGNTTLRITTSSAAPGAYVLTLGPQILSAAGGVPMDNNFNGTPGESPGDNYSATFILPFPSIASSTPAGPATAPVTSVTFNFTQPMDTSSFSVAQDVFSFTGTAGNLIPFITGFTWNTPQQLQINLTGQSLPGNYNLVLNPTINNAGGFPLDINGNGTGGEIPADRYTATFSIGASSASNTFGYRYASTTFDPTLNLVPGSPGVVTLGLSGDDATAFLPLGANTFNYYGTTFTGNTSLSIGTNGNLQFGSAVTDYTNTDLTSSPANQLIAPLWDDMLVTSSSGDLINYQFTADNRLIINWRGIHFFSGSTTDSITFQAVLQLNSGGTAGSMTFNYVDLDSVGSSGTGGSSATVGVKNAGTTPATADPLVAAFNGGGANFNLVGTGKAIRVFKNSPPVANANGPYTVASGSTVQLSSTGSSDPDNDPLTFIWDLDGDGAFGETGAGAANGNETGASPTFNATGLAAGPHQVTLRVLDPSGAFTDSTATVNVTGGAPHVASTVVNAGTGNTSQRSLVTTLTVTFDTVVTFAGAPENAFTFSRTGGGAVNFVAHPSVVGGVTVVTLDSFTGLETEFGSLKDGRYTLTALASQISANGQQLGGGDYMFNDTQGLFRYFGDFNGDQIVNGGDFGHFKDAFGTATGDPNYLGFFDINGDGAINGFDFGQFRTRFGTMLP